MLSVTKRTETLLKFQLTPRNRLGHLKIFYLAFASLLFFGVFSLFLDVVNPSGNNGLYRENVLMVLNVDNLDPLNYYLFFGQTVLEDWLFLLPLGTLFYMLRLKRFIFVPLMSLFFAILHFHNANFPFNTGIGLFLMGLIHMEIYYRSGVLDSSLFHWYSNAIILMIAIVFT